MKTRTRFAPSPTGFLHIGSLRTALYAYALAKHNKGDFILRIEDTDQKREVKGSVDALKDTLKKFGLVWDEYYVQSERLDLYKKTAKKLISEGHAFYCQCNPKNAKEEGYSHVLRDPCREKGLTSGAVKLKVPDNELISYHDFVHKKEISWNSNEVYDATLLKSDGYPTYHLAAMVDDIDMKITHIIRGHDWLPSTPIHLLVFKYLGVEIPNIGHPTDILSAQTGKKLSKRRDSVFVEDFINDGYLPEALLNFVSLLGWAPKDNKELFTLEEFVKVFDINGFQESNPRFFQEKLDWFNGYYIRQKSNEELKKLLKPYLPKKVDKKKLDKIIPLVKERIKKLSDFNSFAGFFFEKPKVDAKLFTNDYKGHLNLAISVLQTIDEWNLEKLNESLMQQIVEKGYKTGDFFMTLRIAITGSKFTPPINDSIIILGKEEILDRLNLVIEN